MNAAIRGTQHTEHAGTESKILRRLGIDYVQKLAGYLPLSMEAGVPMYPPVSEQDAAHADAMMARLCDDTKVINSNPRVPYFMAVWMLIGSDNPYHIFSVSNEKQLVMTVAKLLLRIACGDTPSQHERQTIIRQTTMAKLKTISSSAWKARTRITDDKVQPLEAYHADVLATATLRVAGVASSHTASRAWIAWAIHDVVRELQHISGDKVKHHVRNQARKWCYVDDEQAGRIARYLLFDMLLIAREE